MSYNPYEIAFPTAGFRVISREFNDGEALPRSAYGSSEAENASPELAWNAVPAGTKSFVITAFDADAPIPGGLWHWIIKDVPAETSGLARGAGRAGGQELPKGTVQLANDLGVAGYSGANPPPGTGTHRMFICVTALDTETLQLPERASPAMLNILMIGHTLGRAIIVGTSQP